MTELEIAEYKIELCLFGMDCLIQAIKENVDEETAQKIQKRQLELYDAEIEKQNAE